jgi:AcrR family transcriptional regulator
MTKRNSARDASPEAAAADATAMDATTTDVPSASAATPRLAARRTQAERREESERRMLRAAVELFAERGVSGTSLADIGERAGFSRGLPVSRYGSKVGLIKAVLESMERRSAARRVVALEGKRGLAALRAAIAHRIDMMQGSAAASSALYSVVIASLYSMPELKPYIAAKNDGWRRNIAAHLQDAQSAGEIRADVDCDQQATIIHCLLRGLIIDHMIDADATTLRTVEAAVCRIIADIACVKPPPAGDTPRRTSRASQSSQHSDAPLVF